MNSRQLLGQARPYWRVAVVAVLGGMLAYLGSYAFSPTYVSSTRVLIRGRDTSLLTSTGQNLSGQPGVIDSTLSKALGDTQSAVVGSPAVATAVVDKLGLDQPKPPSSGAVGSVKRFVASAFKHTKAYLTHGFYAEPNARDAAIQEVQSGLSAKPLKDSYVLELTGSASTGAGAADVTNTAADALIDLSTQRYQDEATKNRDFLATQLTRAESDVQAATAAKGGYEKANGITDPNLSQQLSSESRQKLEQDLDSTNADLAATRASLDEANSRLASTDPTVANSSSIHTGRSDTGIDSTQPNATYQALVVDRNRLEGELAGLKARQNVLNGTLSGNPASAFSDSQAGLAPLAERLEAAQKNYQQLGAQYQDAVLAAQHTNIELTRIDTAQVATFPIKPLRYIYLFLGLLCGSLAGAALTWLHRRKVLVPVTAGRADAPVVAGTPRPAPADPGGLMPSPARTKVGRFEIFRPETADGT